MANSILDKLKGLYPEKFASEEDIFNTPSTEGTGFLLELPAESHSIS